MMDTNRPMSPAKAARTVAEVRGWKAGRGGYIYSGDQVICQGWEALGTLLVRSGIFRDGRVNWRRMDLLGDIRTVRRLRSYR